MTKILKKKYIGDSANDNAELAEEIKKRMFVFEDIVKLDNRAIRFLKKWIQRFVYGIERAYRRG